MISTNTDMDGFYPDNLYGFIIDVEGVIDLDSKLNFDNVLRQLKNETAEQNDRYQYTKNIRDEEFNFENLYDEKKITRYQDKFSKKEHKLKLTSHIKSSSSTIETNETPFVTKLFGTHNNVNKHKMFIPEQKIKDNSTINNFIKHIYKQSLKVFDNLKSIVRNTDRNIKPTIKLMKRIYKRTFDKYLNQTDTHKMLTNLGGQNVIRNAIDMSDRILKRLNFFLRVGTLERLYNKERNKQKDIEEKHICQKFNACRSNEQFSEFLIDIIKKMLLMKDFKLKQATDAATEVMKNTEFTFVRDRNTKNAFKIFVDKIETWDPLKIRFNMFNLLSVLKKKNDAIYTFIDNKKIMEHVVAFRELINIMDKNLSTSQKIVEWNEVKGELEDWSVNKREDILEIMEKIVKNFNLGSTKIEEEMATKVNTIMSKLLRANI